MTMSRAEAAKVAAHTRWAHEPDRRSATAPAVNAFLARFERLVDPDGVLPADERAKRAKNALSAHMIRVRSKRKRTTTTTG
jgi:hypothetical protein